MERSGRPSSNGGAQPIFPVPSASSKRSASSTAHQDRSSDGRRSPPSQPLSVSSASLSNTSSVYPSPTSSSSNSGSTSSGGVSSAHHSTYSSAPPPSGGSSSSSNSGSTSSGGVSSAHHSTYSSSGSSAPPPSGGSSSSFSASGTVSSGGGSSSADQHDHHNHHQDTGEGDRQVWSPSLLQGGEHTSSREGRQEEGGVDKEMTRHGGDDNTHPTATTTATSSTMEDHSEAATVESVQLLDDSIFMGIQSSEEEEVEVESPGDKTQHDRGKDTGTRGSATPPMGSLTDKPLPRARDADLTPPLTKPGVVAPPLSEAEAEGGSGCKPVPGAEDGNDKEKEEEEESMEDTILYMDTESQALLQPHCSSSPKLIQEIGGVPKAKEGTPPLIPLPQPSIHSPLGKQDLESGDRGREEGGEDSGMMDASQASLCLHLSQSQEFSSTPESGRRGEMVFEMEEDLGEGVGKETSSAYTAEAERQDSGEGSANAGTEAGVALQMTSKETSLGERDLHQINVADTKRVLYESIAYDSDDAMSDGMPDVDTGVVRQDSSVGLLQSVSLKTINSQASEVSQLTSSSGKWLTL